MPHAPALWTISAEDLCAQASSALTESVFTISNGLIGLRASPPFAAAGVRGSYLNGLHAKGPSDIYFWMPPVGGLGRDMERFPTDELVRQRGRDWALVAAPNVFFATGSAGSAGSSVTELQTRLDLHTGTLHQSGVVALEGRTFRFNSERFASRAEPCVAAERLEIQPQDEAAWDIIVGIDATVRNVQGEKRFDLWESSSYRALDGQATWSGTTTGWHLRQAIAMSVHIRAGTGRATILPDGSGFRIAGQGRLLIERVVAFSLPWRGGDAEAAAAQSCRQSSTQGYDLLHQAHAASWEQAWSIADIRIDGPAEDQRALRYSIFQVLSAMIDTDQVSIGANFLSDEGYHGLVFWDTDVFIMPTILRWFPSLARRHLEWRQRGLPAAQEKARGNGLPGAMFPWESSPTGEEGISPWIILDRTQVHVVADVAWALMEYLQWTGDGEFMQAGGQRLLAETARFWAGRSDARDGSLRDICGPDESHCVVDNNRYTCHLARMNLLWAAEHCSSVPAAERAAWREAATKLPTATPDRDGLLEQFDGFLGLPREQQRAKQADVLMLAWLFPDLFDHETLAANYRFYEPRCYHGSSLSEGTHAIIAARVGELEEAYRFFRTAARMDLHDLHGSTATRGLHAACCAQLPSIIIDGFCGLRRTADGGLSFSARLPSTWQSVTFAVVWQGRRHQLTLADGARADLPGPA